MSNVFDCTPTEAMCPACPKQNRQCTDNCEAACSAMALAAPAVACLQEWNSLTTRLVLIAASGPPRQQHAGKYSQVSPHSHVLSEPSCASPLGNNETNLHFASFYRSEKDNIWTMQNGNFCSSMSLQAFASLYLLTAHTLTIGKSAVLAVDTFKLFNCQSRNKANI